MYWKVLFVITACEKAINREKKMDTIKANYFFETFRMSNIHEMPTSGELGYFLRIFE